MKPEAFPHYHLKIVEIVGFAGCTMDLDIAAFLIECAMSLDTFIVDPRKIFLIGKPSEVKESPEKRTSEEVGWTTSWTT